MELELLI